MPKCQFCGEPVWDGEKTCNTNECLTRLCFAQETEKIIPRRYCRGFDGFPAHSQQMKSIVQRARDWADRFSHDTKKGLYIFGKLATGKSGLAFSILKVLSGRGFRVSWVNVAELIESYQATFDGEGSPRDIRRCLLEHDVILLDDIGVESATAYSAQCLYMLAEQMARDCRPIPIVTGNYSLDKMGERYGGKDGQDNMKRALSRLRFILEEVEELPGENLRKVERVYLRKESK